MTYEIFQPQIFPPRDECMWSDCTRCYMLLKLATMALLRYLRPIDNVLDPQGPLVHSVPSVVVSEVNREVAKEGKDADEKARLLPLIYRGTVQWPVH